MYNININSNVSSFNLNKETSYLCIVNLTAVPPHISFICNGLYFSYSVYGIKLATDAQSRMDVFVKRKIPTVLVDLKLKFTVDEVYHEFNKNEELNTQDSCLNPILNLFEKAGLKINSRPFYLFDLLEWLENSHLINSIFSIGCNDLANGGTISLSKYSQKEIDQQINKIKILKK